jgi:hypothetical protein
MAIEVDWIDFLEKKVAESLVTQLSQIISLAGDRLSKQRKVLTGEVELG